jgi:hypothetical protein
VREVTDRIAILLMKLATVIAIPTMLATIALNLWFCKIGSLTPNPATGRTFAVQEYGTLYVTPTLGELSIMLFFVSYIAVVIAGAILLWLRDSN